MVRNLSFLSLVALGFLAQAAEPPRTQSEVLAASSP
jgi:hypothetical protein